MSDKKVWFITGAGRGMGVDFAKAALAAGNAVVASGRDTDTVAEAVGQAADLLVVRLDVTSRTGAEAAAKLAQALIRIASDAPSPRRFIAGADAIGLAEQKVASLQQQVETYRDIATSMAFENP
jgi:NAD(P)-dependent dehydrogenase (short-subunit alcohol dehydrogenase family)